MRQTQVKPMVEGGILSAVAIVFALISAYMPIVGPFINLVWPVPIILLGVRHGYKWSMLATVVAGLIIAILIHPLQAVGVVVGFGLVGIVMGYAFRAEFSPLKILLYGSVAAVLSNAAVLLISAWVMGFNPLDMQSDTMTKAFEQSVEVYRSFGMKEEDLAKISESMKSMLELVKIILPAGFIMAAVATTYLNFMVAKAVLKKLGHTIADFPLFKYWRMPQFVVYGFALALVMIYWGQSREIVMLHTIGMNLQVFTSMLLFIQGLALFAYLAAKYNLSKPVRGIILFLILSNSLLTQVLIFAGVWDTVVDYRKLNKPRSPE
jgi:uncharacterized protein YybS (DUF2232 family)